MPWMTLVGHSRRFCTCARSRSLSGPLSNNGSGQDIRGGDRVLDREIDADAADRRHRMRGVADAQKPRPVPKRQPVDRDGQELDVVEALEFGNAIGEERSKRRIWPRKEPMPCALSRSADPLAIT